jgi:alpha-ketoglutarate-dependent 2,4-dichlorophenoxyacetate dioxygenase
VPAKYSLLSARILPSWGGNTDFADMRAAYDALDPRTKAEIEELVCEHSLIHSRQAIGFSDLSPEEMAAFRPVRQRLVRTHPVTGCSWRRMPARSRAGRCPRRACSCAT